MSIYFLLVLLSLAVNGILIIPFINILYKLKLQRADQETKDIQNNKTPIFDKFHSHKAGTPVGGGILIVITTVFLFGLGLMLLHYFGKEIVSNYERIGDEVKVLLFTFISFAILGLYDDIKKMFVLDKSSFYGLRMWQKLTIEVILGLVISYWMVAQMKINIVNVPFIGVFDLDWAYVPFATFVIVAFANAVNITDGLDGLSSGVLTITLLAFWVVSVTILDTPLLVFIAVWLGGLITFLYFNVNPARLFLGDTGALSFGATFAVIGLLLGRTFTIPIIGGVFVVEIMTSLLQILSKKFRGKKLFPAAPLHLWLQYAGWPEHKIVMRAWIFSLFFALVGLMVAFMR